MGDKTLDKGVTLQSNRSMDRGRDSGCKVLIICWVEVEGTATAPNPTGTHPMMVESPFAFCANAPPTETPPMKWLPPLTLDPRVDERSVKS